MLIITMFMTNNQMCRRACALTASQTPGATGSFPFPFPQVKTEVGKEVAAARRKQHLSSLQYYCALNALQYRKRMAMMEPLIGFARGQVGRPSPAQRPETQARNPRKVPGAQL